MKAFSAFPFFFLIGNLHPAELPSCGERRVFDRPYGQVERRTDCETSPGKLWIAEFKGDTPHGVSETYDRRTGRKISSTFRLNGETHGKEMSWDSAGNIRGIYNFNHGKMVGKQESFYGPNRPQSVEHYNDLGREEGPVLEWWPNGNKKMDALAKHGKIIQAKEFYPNGKPRAHYRTKYHPDHILMDTRYIEGKSWAPDGRPSGKIVKGQGQWLIWDAEPSDTEVFRVETYKDSVVAAFTLLDSAKVRAWLETPAAKH